MRINVPPRPWDDNSLVQFHKGTATLSVGFGVSHYCDARNVGAGNSETAEMALILNGDFVSLGNDDVRGWVPLSYLPQLLTWLEDGEIEKIKVFLTNL